MKIETKRNGILINMVRLAVGIAGTIQGFIIKEFALSLAGFFLVYMAVAGIRILSIDNFKMELKQSKSPLKEIEHEKVAARL